MPAAGHSEADPGVRQGGVLWFGSQLQGPVPELCGAVWPAGGQHDRAVPEARALH